MDFSDLKYLHEKLLNARIKYGHIDLVVSNALQDNGILILIGEKLHLSKAFFYRLSTDFNNAINELVEVKDVPPMEPVNKWAFEKLTTWADEEKKMPFFSKRLTDSESYL